MKNEEIFDLQSIKSPAIYKHFKNKIYATMGESSPASFDEIEKIASGLNIKTYQLPHIEVMHTELEDYILVFYINNQWHHFNTSHNGPLVIYKSLYDDAGAYARPTEMFASKVDKEKYPCIQQTFRFELVKY